jgi:hypothetical protein
VFVSEQTMFSDDELMAHELEEHPECEFCHTRFFSTDDLYYHMAREHFACHVSSVN